MGGSSLQGLTEMKQIGSNKDIFITDREKWSFVCFQTIDKLLQTFLHILKVATIDYGFIEGWEMSKNNCRLIHTTRLKQI